jgi:hypothetical protein
MLRSFAVRVLALVLCLAFVTALVAAEGTVVSFEKGTVEVKIGDKSEKIGLKGVKVIGADGTELKGKDAGAALKKDTKVDVKKDGDKVTEIKIVK